MTMDNGRLTGEMHLICADYPILKNICGNTGYHSDRYRDYIRRAFVFLNDFSFKKVCYKEEIL